MKSLLVRWLVLALSLLVAAALTNLLLPGRFIAKVGSVGDFLMLMLGVAALALINVTLGTLIKVLTIPLNCLTLGLVSLLVNALMLLIAANLGFGFKIDGFLAAFVGSLLLSAVNAVLLAFVPRPKDDKE
ncbi:MAG: phage holin family protein [Chthonomonadaceae bacterium]|jgi:putative membrane protein|nr:phage holin family protein [Chthonomonadaceae bacterium]